MKTNWSAGLECKWNVCSDIQTVVISQRRHDVYEEPLHSLPRRDWIWDPTWDTVDQWIDRRIRNQLRDDIYGD